jgi:hypothetical protein
MFINGAFAAASTVARNPSGLTSWNTGLYVDYGSGPLDGLVSIAGVLPYAANDAVAASLSGNPWQLFRPRTLYMPTAAAGGGVTGPVGLATETDTAFALAPGAAVGAVGLASETDTAFARAALQLRAVGLASETDAALALAGRLIRPAGLAAEADTAFALDPGAQPGIVGTASETDTALPLAGRAIRPTGLATEADAALALVARGLAPVGLAAETDTAFALFASGPQPVGLAVETDQALALAGSGGQIISLGGRRGGGRAERERRERIAAEVDQLTKDELREVSAMLLAIFETEVFHG